MLRCMFRLALGLPLRLGFMFYVYFVSTKLVATGILVEKSTLPILYTVIYSQCCKIYLLYFTNSVD